MELDPTAALHGRELTAQERVLLRADPPAAVLRWCAAHAGLGPGARVTRVAPLMGGTSSAVHAVDVRDASGARERRLVLRRFVREEWLEEEPDVPVREAAALELMQACPLATPELVALDEDGTASRRFAPAAGGEDAAEPAVPALLMTRVAGALDPTPAPARLDAYLRGLAEALPILNATPVPDATPLPDYDDWGLRIERPPEWTRRPDVWERAFAVLEEPPRDEERRLLHRDYHAGNVLWARDGTVSGIVDWASASVGSPDADVGTCRENLARAISLEAADRFLELHRAASGRGDYDPAWDVRAALGGFDEEDVAGWTPRQEEFLARAVARL